MENKDFLTLSKFLALAGEASRRKAAEEIKLGNVKVGGHRVTNPAYKVNQDDVIVYRDKRITLENKTYILLNKPEGFVTTVSDELNRPTIFDIVKGKQLKNKRLYPVGRLDLNTSGLILITNDGDLTQKLSHPKFEVAKIYQATLDQELSSEAFEKIRSGLRLEDGFAKVDKIYFAKRGNRRKLVVEIHSGKNRIVRRIFKALGYNVVRLERIGYAGLTKKGLPLGYWRVLNSREVGMLKKLTNTSFSESHVKRSKAPLKSNHS